MENPILLSKSQDDGIEQNVEILQKTIEQLKTQIKRSDGEVNLLRFRLFKASKDTSASNILVKSDAQSRLTTSPTTEVQNNDSNRSSSNHYWIQHYIIWKKVMLNLLQSNKGMGNEKPSQASSSVDVVTELQSQLTQYRRLNNRLESQLHHWVDTQIQLHKELAVHDAKVMQFQAVKEAVSMATTTTPVDNVETNCPVKPVGVQIVQVQQTTSCQTSTPVTAIKDASTQKLLRAFLTSPVSATPIASKLTASIEPKHIVDDKTFSDPILANRSSQTNRINIISSTSSANNNENSNPVVEVNRHVVDKQVNTFYKDFAKSDSLHQSSALRQSKERLHHKVLSDVTNSRNAHQLESYDLDDSMLFNFKNSPFPQQMRESKKLSTARPVPAAGLLVELTPCSFQKQMCRMHKENASIKDDIARFRRNLQFLRVEND